MNVQDQRVNSKLFDSIATITVSFILGYGFQLFYNYRRSIQRTSLLWLVFCRCFEKNCTLHCNVIYFQTIYILSSNFMSVNFTKPFWATVYRSRSPCGRPNRPHYVSDPSVCLSVRLSASVCHVLEYEKACIETEKQLLRTLLRAAVTDGPTFRHEGRG